VTSDWPWAGVIILTVLAVGLDDAPQLPPLLPTVGVLVDAERVGVERDEHASTNVPIARRRFSSWWRHTCLPPK
jgi:hypothetical protein